MSALAVYDTAARAAARPAPCNTGCAATVRYPGRRGSALKRLREARGVGQAHLACALGLRRPELVPLEHEAYGALPRGFSTRYQAALETIADGEPPCFAGCGCRAVAP